MRTVRIVVGVITWITAGCLLFIWARGSVLQPEAKGRRVANELWEFATAQRRFVRLQLGGDWPLSVGDPIYRMDHPGRIEQIGEIRRVDRDESNGKDAAPRPIAEALLYPQAPDVGDGSYLTYYTTPRSLAWVVETMLPREKRVRVAEEILFTYESYHGEILDALMPVVVGGFADAMEVLEDDLTVALGRHREQLERLGSRYQDRVVEQDIVPLVRKEILPIVQRQAEPLANDIGKELFERASIWRFGWRVLYDRSFLPEKNLTQEEWNRFVREEGLPVLDRHRADIVRVQRKVLEDIAKNQKVRTAVRRNLARVIDDPEFREIVWQIFREVLLDNKRLHQRLEERWNTVEAQRAVQLAGNYVEPCVRRIGDLLFGTRQDGIAPEFAQVLRNQILDKDCRWLVISTPPDSVPMDGSSGDTLLPVRLGGYPKVNPFAVQLRGIE